MDKRSLQFLVIVCVAYFGVHALFGMWKDDQKAKSAAAVEQVQTIPAPAMQSRPIQALSVQADPTEEFYVLQNDYQQLVFSTSGGALAEINLPLQSFDPKSLVKEIDIDREILKQSPQNAQFPLHPYYLAQDGTPVLKETLAQGGYYPLLRRSILNQNGSLRSYVDPSYYALTIIGDATTRYKVTNFTANSIQFKGSSKGRTITKTFTIPQVRSGPYCLELAIDIDGDASDLLLSSGVPDAELVGGAYAPQLKYQVKVVGGAEVEEIKLPKEGMTQELAVTPFWISNCNGFLGLILDPLTPLPNGFSVQKVDGNSLQTRLSLIDAAYQLYPAASYPGYATLLPLPSGSSSLRIFAGPYDQSLLKKLDALYEEPSQNYNPEYNLAISIQGWFSFISQPFSKLLFLLMQLFYAITHSWAVSIVLLTVALRAMMYPLNNWSIKSTVKMQEMAPRIKEIDEKYKNDAQKANLEKMKLYKESGANPITGCLPMLLQMPFLIGMFYMLKSSFPLRGAPFIPGWIDDLAAPDVLFSWGQPIWLIGNEFHLLPILTGLVMFIQGKMTQKLPKDPSKLTDAEKQQKMMGTMMSVVFTLMFYSFPSGLNIYFMISTLLGIVQQKFLMNKFKATSVKNGLKR